MNEENSLSRAASAYLRSARHQPVKWHEWGAEAFEKARRENKPVLLDIGAVWCHWCHVMDRESYENEETAAVVNDHFIAVKVDRDERPDVDTRYQSAVATISGQGGWPLTAFLTPEGKPYFGGTYFPPDERYGRPSFKRVLLTMAHAFAERREEVEESASSILTMIEHNESFAGRSGELSPQRASSPGTPHPGALLLEKIIESALRQFDARNGGFGSQPKFPNSGAINLLIDSATRGGAHADAARNVAIVTLKKMAAGGIHDQLAGGFHRYSVDEQWIVPHFEKMAYDNSELLKNYAHAFQSFADPEFAQVANGILRWMDEWLSDRERGGFYASQDADDSLDDDGDYFTWTRDEVQGALAPEEFRVAEAYFNVRPVGDMHHNPAKNVLHTPRPLDEVAKVLKLDEAKAGELLRAAKETMYAARLKRRTPYVDKTVYTGWNGMCISAYIAAGRALGLKEPVEFALKSIDRVVGAVWSDAGLGHVVAYGEGVAPERAVPGVLDDYALVANAALDAWEASGEMRYFDAAQQIADAMLKRFYDVTGCGFFDTELNSMEERIGALAARRKPLQDSPTPSGNAVAATVLLRLAALTNNKDYETRAEETLEAFAGVVEHFGLYAASYALALRRMIEPPVQVCVVGEDLAAKELLVTSMARFVVNKSVIQLRREQLETLPPALAETLPHAPAGDGGFAMVCKGNSCLPPIVSDEELEAALT